jgi:hypothetical protein
MPARMRSSITGYIAYAVGGKWGTRWMAILAVTVVLLVASAVAALAGVALPPVTGQQPAVKDAGPRHVGPTENITKVANALTVRAKSLTTLVKVLPGLALTKPVTIIVDYSSPAGKNRISQTYEARNGNRILYNDPVGNRYPRQLTMSITLTEDNPGGPPFTYSYPPGKLTLDPLFDVSITPLRFTLQTNCDRVGKSEIQFMWYSPEAKYREKGFSTKKGNLVTIGEFAWSRQEVSASAKLLWPTWAFIEKDTNVFSPQQWSIPKQDLKLLPTTASGYVGRSLKEASGKSGCAANTAFDVTVEIRQYQNL